MCPSLDLYSCEPRRLCWDRCKDESTPHADTCQVPLLARGSREVRFYRSYFHSNQIDDGHYLAACGWAVTPVTPPLQRFQPVLDSGVTPCFPILANRDHLGDIGGVLLSDGVYRILCGPYLFDHATSLLVGWRCSRQLPLRHPRCRNRSRSQRTAWRRLKFFFYETHGTRTCTKTLTCQG